MPTGGFSSTTERRRGGDKTSDPPFSLAAILSTPALRTSGGGGGSMLSDGGSSILPPAGGSRSPMKTQSFDGITSLGKSPSRGIDKHSRPESSPLLNSPPIGPGGDPLEMVVVEETVSPLGMTVSLVTGGLGSGLLTLPWGMAGVGILAGGCIIMLVLLLNGFTIMILVHAAERFQKFDLGSVLSLLPGRIGPATQYFCNFLVWLTMWMVLVGSMIVVQDSATPLMPAGTLFAQRWVWATVGSALVVPLCFLDLKYLGMRAFITREHLLFSPSSPNVFSPPPLSSFSLCFLFSLFSLSFSLSFPVCLSTKNGTI
jgi:hypothetical protein